MRAIAVVAVLSLTGCATDPAPEPWVWSLPLGFPTPRVPADNPMTAAKVELGRHLFHDVRLSANGTQACASCHDQARAFTDGHATPRGSTGDQGRHNAMSLVNVAYNSTQTWAANVPGLEAQARLPMFGTAPVELGLTGDEVALLDRLRAEPAYQVLFPAAFPDAAEAFSIDHVTHALAAFERTILSGDNRVDRFVNGDRDALDEAAQRGLALFESERLGCVRCHGGFNLTATTAHEGAPGVVQFFNTGLYDVDGAGAYPAGDRGLIEVTDDPAHEGRFRPPTLRNIAVTAPYMHDGSVSTLGEVLDIYARGGRRIEAGPNAGDGATSPRRSPLLTGFTLTADERAELLAFLGALTDEALLVDPAFANPWP